MKDRLKRNTPFFHKVLSGLTAVLLVASSIGVPESAFGAQRMVRIGILMDGKWSRHPDVTDLFRKEILTLTEGEFDVQFPDDAMIDGAWDISAIRKGIDELLSRKGVDLIITIGTVSSNEICKRRELKKPVIAPFVIDAQRQNLPLRDGVSGVKNLNYIDTARSVSRNVQEFIGTVGFKHLTILLDSLMLQTMPEISDHVREIAAERGIDIDFIPVKESAEDALKQLSPDTDAVLLSYLQRLTEDDFRKLADGLIERKLPSFSFRGRSDVELGILVSLYPKEHRQFLARSTAINVYEILNGEDAGTLNVSYSVSEKLTINMATARAIDVHPSLRRLTEADLINEEPTEDIRVLTIDKVVREAITANLDLAVASKIVAAGEQSVKEVRSQLLPQIGVGTETVVIDDDRAKASGGQAPERTWSGTATLSQSLYSDSAWTDYTVEKHFQDARTEEFESTRLDIIRDAAVTYFEVLRAKSLERIQKNNLSLTRENLERAQIRASVGIAGPDEVYRWETEIGNRRQNVLQAETNTLNEMVRLNRILHRPINETFIAQEAEFSDPLLALSDTLYIDLVKNPKLLYIFSDFMVIRGIENAPELRRLDAEIAARQRTITSAKRAYWLPDFSLEGEVRELFDEGGEGKRDDSLADFDDTDWSVGVFARLPLFTSGQKTATLNRSREEMSRLQFERDATAERIEENVRNAINFTRASYPSIRLSREAAEAAHKNLDLVTESYERGTKSIIDLLDAQNSALVSDSQASNTVYNFLIDLMEIQRASGRFGFSLTEEQRQEWMKRFRDFAQTKGVVIQKQQ